MYFLGIMNNAAYYVYRYKDCRMKTIQMTLDENLIKEVDKEIKKLNMTRSVFTREALRKCLDYYHQIELEKKQIAGYKNKPVKSGEFDVWEDEQEWID